MNTPVSLSARRILRASVSASALAMTLLMSLVVLAQPPDSASGGGKIAFVSDRDGNAEIYVMNADGSDQKRLTHDPASDSTPCFSPDGRKIVFASDRDGTSNIYVMN